MLFSFFIGVTAAAYFLFRTLLIKMKFFFAGRKAVHTGLRHQFVIYNEALHYYIVFKSIIDEFEKRRIPVLYLTSAENDPTLVESRTYISTEYIGSGNKAYARLNFLEADICLMTTPGLEVYQLKRSKLTRHYAHILHDTGDATCYRLFGIDWFDSLLLSGSYQIEDIRKLEKMRHLPQKELAVVGSTYLDVYKARLAFMQPEAEHPFTVLVSPSWGPGSLLDAFGKRLLDPLVQTGWRIIVRPHPQLKKNEPEMLTKLEKHYGQNSNVVWDYEPENLASLSRSDIMISDFSGIIFDFVFLFDKPVIYANAGFNREMYDAGDIDHDPWKFEAVKEFGVVLQTEDLPHIKSIITGAMENGTLQTARKTARDKAWENQGEGAKAAVDFLVKVQERIQSC